MPPYLVTSGADSGPGTLRDGLGSGATVITIDAGVVLDPISGTLYYDGVDPLEIAGSGQTILGGNGETLFEVTMGADLTISDLTFDGGGGDGSPASVYAMLQNVTIDGVGYGGFDSDGLRIDDRGDGDILLEAFNSTFINVGADGVELDEGDNGNKKCGANLISGSGKGWLQLKGDNEFWPNTDKDGDCFDNGGIDGIELDGVELK